MPTERGPNEPHVRGNRAAWVSVVRPRRVMSRESLPIWQIDPAGRCSGIRRWDQELAKTPHRKRTICPR